jgi:Tfp pilus assembly protein PilV
MICLRPARTTGGARRPVRSGASCRGRSEQDEGFGLIEIMVASVILIVVVISLSNLLIDSLQAALLSRQREQAASLASDVVENGKALGQASLSKSPATPAPPPPPAPQCTPVKGAPVPVLTQLTFQQCFTAIVDKTTYTVSPTISTPCQTGVIPCLITTTPDTVKVTVTWSSGAYTYLTSSKVGT